MPTAARPRDGSSGCGRTRSRRGGGTGFSASAATLRRPGCGASPGRARGRTGPVGGGARAPRRRARRPRSGPLAQRRRGTRGDRGARARADRAGARRHGGRHLRAVRVVPPADLGGAPRGAAVRGSLRGLRGAPVSSPAASGRRSPIYELPDAPRPAPQRAGLLEWVGMIAVAIVAVAADQITKSLATRTLDHGEVVKILPFFDLRRIKNTGIAFG